jgi:SPP1 family phage portal protein
MIQRERGFFDGIDAGKVTELAAEAAPYLAHRARLYARYRRKAGPNAMMSAGEGRAAMPYEHYITRMALGYLSGRPPVYTVSEAAGPGGDADAAMERAAAYQAEIDRIRRYNDDAAVFSELVKDYLIKAAAYLYVTENENNEVVYTRFDSLGAVAVYDYGAPPYPVALVRVWDEGGGGGEPAKKRVEVVTERSRRVFDESGRPVPFEDYVDGELREVDEKPLLWGDVPIVAFEEPDGIALLEPAVPLIDNGETVVTNIGKALRYNDAAKLLVSGYVPKNERWLLDENGDETGVRNPARDAEEKAMYEATVYFLEQGGDLAWLLKNVDFTGALAYLDRLDDFITMFAAAPNVNDESFGGAASGVALGYKLYTLDQAAAVADRVFKRGYLRLWEIVTNRLNLKTGAGYDFRAVDVKFERNAPTDAERKAGMAASLHSAGLASLETAIGISGIDVDAESEMARIANERLRIRTVRELREALASDPPLIDPRTALGMMFGEDEAARMLPEVERFAAERAGMAAAAGPAAFGF